MTYYRVKPRYDNYVYNRKTGDILIANELFTPREAEKKNLILGMLEKVQVSRARVYWFFGARFEEDRD